MVTLPLSRSRSSSSLVSRGSRRGDATRNYRLTNNVSLVNSPGSLLSSSSSSSSSSASDEATREAFRSGIVVARASSTGGDARENRPPSAQEQTKATQRAAKKLLKLLGSSKRAIMKRNVSASSSMVRGRSASGPERPSLQGSRSMSLPVITGASSPSLVSRGDQVPTNGTLSGGYRQGFLEYNSVSRAAGSVRGTGYEAFYSPGYGYSQQKEALFDSPNGGVAAFYTYPKGQLKDDGTANALRWLHDHAPLDILPRVLSFAGSRAIDSLSRTCKSWRTLTLSEAVWRTACEDTGKWKVGESMPKDSWLQHYRENPLVPIDYSSLEAAFSVYTFEGTRRGNLIRRGELSANNIRPVVPEHRRSVRVLLRPGRYVIRESLIVHAMGDNRVTIETAEVPGRVDDDSTWMPSHIEDAILAELDHRYMAEFEAGESAVAEGAGSYSSSRMLSRTPSRRLSKRATSLKNLLSCRSTAEPDVRDEPIHRVGGDDDNITRSAAALTRNLSGYGFDGTAVPFGSAGHDLYSAERYGCSPPKRAVLVLKTRNENEPIVRVRQGTVHLRNLDLIHNSSGVDIWNGNAAVQVQPPIDERDNALPATPPSIQPTAVLDKVNIMSHSGRGIVNIDGGNLAVNDCCIHHCAATGVYVGGPGSVADIFRTDVVHNGNGNQEVPRGQGIARGHSGVYLEQGVAALRDCNVSNNSLTGISAISSDNATLTVENTDLMSNGSIQLEMPPLGSISHRRSVSVNNTISASGRGRLRSGLVVSPSHSLASDEVRGTPRRRRRAVHDRTARPQSPAVGDAAAGDLSRLPAATMYATLAASAVSARRMRFAALNEEALAPAAAPSSVADVLMAD